jgi:hypothetical protein
VAFDHASDDGALNKRSTPLARKPTNQASAVGEKVALMSVLVLELVVAASVARRAIVVRAAIRTVFTPVVPSPAFAVLAVFVATAVAESPCILLLDPLALASLIPIVLIGSEQAGR